MKTQNRKILSVLSLFLCMFLSPNAMAVTLVGLDPESEVINFGVNVLPNGTVSTPTFYQQGNDGVFVSSDFFFFGFNLGGENNFSATIDLASFLASVGRGDLVADPTKVEQASLYVDAFLLSAGEGTVTVEGTLFNLASNSFSLADPAGPIDDFDDSTSRIPGEFGGTLSSPGIEFDSTFLLNGAFLNIVQTVLLGDGMLDFLFENTSTPFFGQGNYALHGFNLQLEGVPEPLTASLLLMGLGGAAALRRKES